MKKDALIELLRIQIINLNEQLKSANDFIKESSAKISALTELISELNARIASMEQAVSIKDQDITKQKKIIKGLSKISQNKSEKITPAPIPVPTKEEIEILEKARAIKCKQRKNNGAKRNMYPDMEVEMHIVNPNDPNFDIDKAKIVGAKDDNGEYPYRTVIRYECVPMRFIKHEYRIYTYSQDGKIYEGETPKSAFFNSNYDASFLAGIMQLRYIYSMPVERIVKYFEDNGFALHKSTANGFIKRASELLENVYKAIAVAIKESDYIAVDETYYKVLIPFRKGSKKAYFWVIIGVNNGLIYAMYEDGSRSEEVILNQLKDYSGMIQSDAFTAYKKLESESYPNIRRIACLQHIKRKFIDCGDDKDAKRIVKIINELYQKEHKHKVGVENWTVEKNLKWRSKYAPPILEKLKKIIDKISLSRTLLPKEDFTLAINHIRKEWSAITGIFSRGDTNLDNNLIERYNRYFSISRRNSLFFGSHKGAERGAILYTLALSCRMNKINFFDYIKDIINQTSDWQPNTPLEKYRELLPDKWNNKSK